MHDGVVRVARHEQHLEPGPIRDETIGELAAAHARHDHVREQELDHARVVLTDLNRLHGIAGGHQIVAHECEDIACEVPHILRVFDEQDGLRASDVARGRRVRG